MASSVQGQKMNVVDAHPWMSGAAGALCMAAVNTTIGWLRRVSRAPEREDFQALERRLTSQITQLQGSVAAGMTDLQGRIHQLGENVYKRLDDKTDALNKRIDDLVGARGGGR